MALVLGHSARFKCLFVFGPAIQFLFSFYSPNTLYHLVTQSHTLVSLNGFWNWGKLLVTEDFPAYSWIYLCPVLPFQANREFSDIYSKSSIKSTNQSVISNMCIKSNQLRGEAWSIWYTLQVCPSQTPQKINLFLPARFPATPTRWFLLQGLNRGSHYQF